MKANWWNKLIENPPFESAMPKSLRELIDGMEPRDRLLMAAGAEYYQAVAGDLSAADERKIQNQCICIGKPGVFDGGEFPDVFREILRTWCPINGGHGKLLAALKREYERCSAIQILNRSAQYLIKHYFNEGQAPGGLPTD